MTMTLAGALKVAANVGNEFDTNIRAALPVLAAGIKRLEGELSQASARDLAERLRKIRRFVDEETKIRAGG